VQVIYDTTNPANAAIYSVWGYWVRWQEIFFSILLIIVAYYGAVAITKNPTAESLAEQMQEKKNKTPQIQFAIKYSFKKFCMKTICLLIVSNVFMTFAWYWHLKIHRHTLVESRGNKLGHCFF